MLRKKNLLASGVKALSPVLILNPRTGEIVSQTELNTSLDSLGTYVQEQAINYYKEYKTHILERFQSTPLKHQPELYARQAGWSLPSLSDLSREVKAKSRIERLWRHKLVTTIASYVYNPNPNKQEPGFTKDLNLGAIDNQMASLALLEQQLVLTLKAWDKEYVIYFDLPAYLLERDINKFSLPNIRSTKNGWVFDITLYENIVPRVQGVHSAGLDLGRVEPFTLAVVNQDGARVAHYTSSSRLNQLNKRRETLLYQKQRISRKIRLRKKLNLPVEHLEKEHDRRRAKATRLGTAISNHIGSEVTKKLSKHKVSTLNLENLKWVTGAKYGSRWNHSRQQDAITHALARQGINTRTVNPKNTSRQCYKCGTILLHNKRTVWCRECKTRLDRDFNAAMNIARDMNNNKSKNVCLPYAVRTSTAQEPILSGKQAVAPKLNHYVFNNKNKKTNDGGRIMRETGVTPFVEHALN